MEIDTVFDSCAVMQLNYKLETENFLKTERTLKVKVKYKKNTYLLACLVGEMLSELTVIEKFCCERKE